MKFIFHITNILLIVLYLFPGSIIGWFLYDDLIKQPQLTNDFGNISSNHIYAFFILSSIGIISYKNNKNFNLLIIYLLILAIILELLHLLIPVRSFQLGDLFGNILGVIISLLIYNLRRIVK